MDISPTRSALLETKDKILLAKKGKNLLKKKQDALIARLYAYLADYKELSKKVREKSLLAHKDLFHATAYDGNFALRSQACSTKDMFDFSLKRKNIMGVVFHAIHGKKVGSFKGEQTPLLASAQDSFESLFSVLLSLAEVETAIVALADEIQKTKRRVNSLENIQIPKLEDVKKYISFQLEERDRDEFTKLKHVKNMIAEQEE